MKGCGGEGRKRYLCLRGDRREGDPPSTLGEGEKGEEEQYIPPIIEKEEEVEEEEEEEVKGRKEGGGRRRGRRNIGP